MTETEKMLSGLPYDPITIGSGAVVASGAVVTRDVPPMPCTISGYALTDQRS